MDGHDSGPLTDSPERRRASLLTGQIWPFTLRQGFTVHGRQRLGHVQRSPSKVRLSLMRQQIPEPPP